MTKTIFITGGSGFIGRETARKLLINGYKVICFDLGIQFARNEGVFSELKKLGDLKTFNGTILDRIALKVVMMGSDVTIHMAAVLGVKRTEENRLRCMETNVNGTDIVLSACVFSNVEHVIFASSSEVYGEPSSNPIKETNETKGKTVYAVSKLAGEELVKGYNQLFPSMNYTIVRFFNTYGEGQVAQFALARFVKAVVEGRNPVVYGDGTQERSYGHVDDITDGILEIVRNPISRNKVYNLGNSSQVNSLNQLARKVIDVLAPDSGLEVDILNSFDGSDRTKEREIHTRYCNTTLAFEDLGFNPSITVEEGIRRLAESKHIHDDWPE